MKKVFETPSISVTKFSVENIVTASGDLPIVKAMDFGEQVVSASQLILKD